MEVLSCDWYVLRKTTFDYQHTDGHRSREEGETYPGSVPPPGGPAPCCKPNRLWAATPS